MKIEVLRWVACPICKKPLSLDGPSLIPSFDELNDGELACSGCGALYPVENHVPRFVPRATYASSFGFQWQKHARTQLDSVSGTTISRDRFFKVTKWPENMADQTILEAGCGAGRFTEIALSTSAIVFSFDYSLAVDANFSNNGHSPNLHLFQADIYHIPFREAIFDKIFCFGVLQHCPDVKRAFMSLCPFLKRGGEIVIDVYNRYPWIYLMEVKYWLRPITKHMTHKKLYRIVEAVVPFLVPLKERISIIPFLWRYLAGFIPVPNYKGKYPLSPEQLLEWSILDTFDMLSPMYDQPQRIEDVRDWFSEARLTNVWVEYGPNGINGRGTKA